MTVLAHALERTMTIGAPPATVFRFFTDTPRWAAWWGAGSTIDPRPGGRVLIVYPGGHQAAGEVVEVSPPSRIVFTYGYVSGTPIGPGESRVTIELQAQGNGTRLHFTHEVPTAEVRDHHVQGWRYHLSVVANVVADDVHAGAAQRVDAWFDAWAETDDGARGQALDALVTPDIRFRDRYSCIEGRDELVPHIGAALRFMPGMRVRRSGDVRHCQGTVLADWTATGPDGSARGAGSSVFTMNADGRIAEVTGFWKS